MMDLAGGGGEVARPTPRAFGFARVRLPHNAIDRFGAGFYHNKNIYSISNVSVSVFHLQNKSLFLIKNHPSLLLLHFMGQPYHNFFRS